MLSDLLVIETFVCFPPRASTVLFTHMINFPIYWHIYMKAYFPFFSLSPEQIFAANGFNQHISRPLSCVSRIRNCLPYVTRGGNFRPTSDQSSFVQLNSSVVIISRNTYTHMEVWSKKRGGGSKGKSYWHLRWWPWCAIVAIVAKEKRRGEREQESKINTPMPWWVSWKRRLIPHSQSPTPSPSVA